MKRVSTLTAFFTATLALMLATPSVAEAGPRKMIRFYKVNDKGQETRQSMVRNTDEPGCHNVRRSLKASRVVVLGFSWCEVYAEKDCDPQSRLVANWDGERKKSEAKRQPNGRMDKGTRWVLNPVENIPVASFNCESE